MGFATETAEAAADLIDQLGRTVLISSRDEGSFDPATLSLDASPALMNLRAACGPARTESDGGGRRVVTAAYLVLAADVAGTPAPGWSLNDAEQGDFEIRSVSIVAQGSAYRLGCSRRA